MADTIAVHQQDHGSLVDRLPSKGTVQRVDLRVPLDMVGIGADRLGDGVEVHLAPRPVITPPEPSNRPPLLSSTQ